MILNFQLKPIPASDSPVAPVRARHYHSIKTSRGGGQKKKKIQHSVIFWVAIYRDTKYSGNTANKKVRVSLCTTSLAKSKDVKLSSPNLELFTCCLQILSIKVRKGLGNKGDPWLSPMPIWNGFNLLLETKPSLWLHRNKSQTHKPQLRLHEPLLM